MNNPTTVRVISQVHLKICERIFRYTRAAGELAVELPFLCLKFYPSKLLIVYCPFCWETNMDYRTMYTELPFVFLHGPLHADLVCKCSTEHICAAKAQVLILWLVCTQVEMVMKNHDYWSLLDIWERILLNANIAAEPQILSPHQLKLRHQINFF